MVVTGTVRETLVGLDTDLLVTTAQPQIDVGFEGVPGDWVEVRIASVPSYPGQ